MTSPSERREKLAKKAELEKVKQAELEKAKKEKVVAPVRKKKTTKKVEEKDG
jgi:hypothetical protein